MRVIGYISNVGILEGSEVSFHLLILFFLHFTSKVRTHPLSFLVGVNWVSKRFVSPQAFVWEPWDIGERRLYSLSVE